MSTANEPAPLPAPLAVKPFAGALNLIKANPMPPPGQVDNPIIPDNLVPAPEPTKVVIEEPVKPAAKVEKVDEPKHSVFGTETKKLEVVEDMNEETKGMTAKAKASWIHLRGQEKLAKTQEQEIVLLKKNLEELGKKQNTDIETPGKLQQAETTIAELKAQLESYEGEISMSRVESSKVYGKEVAVPKAKLEEHAKAIAKRYELSEKKILDALREPPESRNAVLEELTQEFGTIDKTDLLMIGKGLDTLEARAEELRQEAKSKKLHVEQQQNEAVTQASEEYRTNAFQAAERAYRKAASELPFLDGKTGNEEWDNWIAQQSAQTMRTDLTDPTVAGSIKAQAAQLEPVKKAYEHFKGLYEKAIEERDEANERIKLYEQGEPSVGGSRSKGAPVAEEEKPSMGSAVARVLAGAGLR